MIKQAHDAYNTQDYIKAFELYTLLAEKGDADAQASLGFMYQNGQECMADEAKALTWYEKAAGQKQPYALFNLGVLYANGTGGVEHDQFRSYEFFLEAATREVPPAMYETALMLEKGLGCIQNYSEAAFWYEEAAKRGHREAFNNLGVLYKEGHGVEQDHKKAFTCFSRAAELELAQAQYNLGLLYDQGLGVEEDHDKALELCRKAAYNGHKKAKAIIRGLQEEGKIVF
jgi:TPR repeat protein